MTMPQFFTLLAVLFMIEGDMNHLMGDKRHANNAFIMVPILGFGVLLFWQ